MAQFALLSLIVSGVFIVLSSIDLAQADQVLKFILPYNFRSDGRLTLDYEQGDQRSKHQYVFSEYVDGTHHRSKTTIGYVSYTPNEYYYNQQSILRNFNGKCIEETLLVVPEINWFLDISNEGYDLATALSNHPEVVGPSSFVHLLVYHQGTNQLTSSGSTVHRNIECEIYRYILKEKPTEYTFEVYRPKTKWFQVKDMPYFTVVVTKVKAADTPGAAPTKLTATLDYFRIDEYNDPASQLALSQHFNLPLGVGCSKYISRTIDFSSRIDIETNSFMMTFNQKTTGRMTTVAYDHQGAFLLREVESLSSSIWDLREGLLYYVDTLSGSDEAKWLLPNANRAQDVKSRSCSVLNVAADNLPPAFRPFKPFEGVADPDAELQADIFNFLGTKKLAFISHGEVSGIPCLIFERILDEPPKVFGLTHQWLPDRSSQDEKEAASSGWDFIVQYYLFPTEKMSKIGSENVKQTQFDVGELSPARISLLRRDKVSGVAKLVDSLEISDFHWGLSGWRKKPNELFLASQCFDVDDEQVRIQLALGARIKKQATFVADGAAQGGAGGSSLASSKQLRKILAHNKFNLEFELTRSIFREHLRVSPMHLVDYELELTPHNVLLSLVVGDRDERKELQYFGTGELADPSAYKKSRLTRAAISEQRCVGTASLVSGVSLAIYCPADLATFASSVCTIIYGESSPEIKVTQPAERQSDAQAHQPAACQVYRFYSMAPAGSAVARWLEWKKALLEPGRRSFDYRPQDTLGDPQLLLGFTVNDFDVSRAVELIKINYYKFAVDDAAAGDQQPARPDQSDEPEFERRVHRLAADAGMQLEAAGDCARMCNLDTNCRSYSFCARAQLPTSGGGGECTLSRLDLRAAKVDQQLVRATLVDKKWLLIRDQQHAEGEQADEAHEYKLEMASECDIFERDYVNFYTQTDEVVQLNRLAVKQFASSESLFDCAKYSIDFEQRQPDHHVAMFAFCSQTNTCILDENLFAELRSQQVTGSGNSTSSSSAAEDDDEPDEGGAQSDDDSIECNLYKKRYQTYFHVSGRVLERSIEPNQQVELSTSGAEECARACWMQYGQVCASFDFCAPTSCLINHLGAYVAALAPVSGATALRWETRANCLHYERDLKLDELRVSHLIGRHRTLDVAKAMEQIYASRLIHAAPGRLFGGFLGLVANVILFAAVAGAFVLGLAAGKQLNARLERVTILRQSIPSAVGRRLSHAFGFTRFESQADDWDQRRRVAEPADGDHAAHTNGTGDAFYATAIQLDEIKRHPEDEEEEEEKENQNRNKKWD